MADDDAIRRPEEDDDYDLLTYGEAGARLAEEIQRQTRRLTELESGGADDVEIAAVQRRIAELEEASRRQQAAASESADFTKFFGYDPKSK